MAASSVCLTSNGIPACGSKSSLTKEIYGMRLASTAGVPSLSLSVPRPASVSAALEQKQNAGRRGFLKLLLGNVGLSLPTLMSAKGAYADEQGVSSSRMSYSRFL